MKKAKTLVAPAGPTRGRPREFDRAKALDRALAVFWRQGYEGASLANLTAAMKITPPSLYAAFGSKQRLYLEAVDRYRSDIGAGTARALAGKSSARAAVAQVLREAARDFSARDVAAGCMISTAMLACAPEHREVAGAVAALRARTITSFRDRFERAIAEGELPRRTDIEGLARYVGAVIQGMSVQARDGACRETLNAIATVAMRAWPTAKKALTRNRLVATHKNVAH